MVHYTNESINQYMKKINETEHMKSYVNSLMEVGDVRELDDYKMLLIYGMFNKMIGIEKYKGYLTYLDGEKILSASNIKNSKEESKRLMDKLASYCLISPSFTGIELEGFVCNYPFTSSLISVSAKT